MNKFISIIILCIVVNVNAQTTIKLGGQVGFEKFLRGNPVTSLDSVQLSYRNSGDSRIFGGIFAEFPIKSTIRLEYALNFFKEYNTTYSTILRNSNEYLNLTRISYWAIHNSFLVNKYLSKRLYLTGGLSLQINANKQKGEYPHPENTQQYVKGLHLIHQAIEMNTWILGGLVGIGYEIGRLRLQARFQSNFNNFNKRTINPWDKEYEVTDRSFNLFLGTSFILFKK